MSHIQILHKDKTILIQGTAKECLRELNDLKSLIGAAFLNLLFQEKIYTINISKQQILKNMKTLKLLFLLFAISLTSYEAQAQQDTTITTIPFFINHTIKCGQQYQITVLLDSEREAFEHNEYTYKGTIYTEEAGNLHCVNVVGIKEDMRWYKIEILRVDVEPIESYINIGRFNIN